MKTQQPGEETFDQSQSLSLSRSYSQLEFQYGEERIVLDVEVERDDAEGRIWRVRLPDGTEHRLQAVCRPDDVLQITEIIETIEVMQTFRVPFARLSNGKDLAFSYDGMTYTFHKPAPGVTVSRSEGATGAMTAPMAGIVADILVEEGQTVAAYQPLVVIEAMKVMTTLEAPFAGVVKSLHVQLKQQIAHDAPVIEVVKIVESASKAAEGIGEVGKP